MSGDLRLLNRQRARDLDLRLLRQIIGALLADLLKQPHYDLTVHLVSAPAMARVNQAHLGHSGPTDVITLDYAAPSPENLLAGEIFVCVDVAIVQAREFRAHWTVELVRYLVHGVLHLRGFDDGDPARRRVMKRAEARWLRELGRRFRLRKLARKSKLGA